MYVWVALSIENSPYERWEYLFDLSLSFVIFSSFACDSVRCHRHDPAMASGMPAIRYSVFRR